jgi:hypothetical protein
MTSAYTGSVLGAAGDDPPCHRLHSRQCRAAHLGRGERRGDAALQYAIRRHYETPVTGYLRQVRLEQAHRELRDGDSAADATVAATARRWGWASPMTSSRGRG